MKTTILGLTLFAALVAAGCGDSNTTTAAEEAGFKDRSTTNLPTPPAGAMEKATNVQSSLGGSGGPGNVKPPTPGPGG